MSSRSTTGDPYLDFGEDAAEDGASQGASIASASGSGGCVGGGPTGHAVSTPSIYVSNGSGISGDRGRGGGVAMSPGTDIGGYSGSRSVVGDVTSHNSGGINARGSINAHGGHYSASVTGIQSTSYGSGASQCPNHPNADLSYLCQSCEMVVCHTCVETSHGGHVFTPLATSVDNQRCLLEDCARLANKSATQLEERIGELGRILEAEELIEREVGVQIDSTFHMIDRIIQQRKSRLRDQLQQRLGGRRERIETLQKELEKRSVELNSSLAALRNVLARGTDLDVLTSRRDIGERLIRLTKAAIPLHPAETDTVAFVPTELDQLFAMIHRVGLIAVTSAQPDKTRAVGQALKGCQIHNQETITVVPRDEQDRPVDVIELEGLSASLSTPWEKAYQVSVEKSEDGSQGQVHYRIEEAGKYELSIKWFGEHIKGSPFTVEATDPNVATNQERNGQPRSSSRLTAKSGAARGLTGVRSTSGKRSTNVTLTDDLLYRMGVHGRDKGEFNNPQGVCITRNRRILIADSNNANIQIFSAIGGDFRSRFGNRGREDNQLQRPIDIAETINGNYLIADYDNRCVKVFSPDGKFISKFGQGKLMGPKGVAVDKQGRVVVVDNKGCCVCVFKATGKFLFKFGSRGNAEHQFAGPHYVAVATSNDILVTDFHHHSVKVFDSEGQFVSSFGSNGKGNGQFNAPTGIAMDNEDNIVVADWGNSRIQIFDRSGNFLNFVNSNADPLYGPQGLALNNREFQLVVADTGNHCFKVYKYPFGRSRAPSIPPPESILEPHASSIDDL